MKSSRDKSKEESGTSARGRATQSEKTGVQTKDELGAYHKRAADILVGLNAASLDPEDPCEQLMLSSLGPDGRVDKSRYWKKLQAAPVQQQRGILADADSRHWRLVAGGVDPVSWSIFWIHYAHHKTAGNARYKAVHGLPRLNRRGAIEFVKIANEVAVSGDNIGKQLLVALIIERIKQRDFAFFSHIGEALKGREIEVQGSQEDTPAPVDEEVFRKFCQLYIKSGKLPTKAQVRKECKLGEAGEDPSSASSKVNRAFSALGLSGLPEQRGGGSKAKRLSAAIEILVAGEENPVLARINSEKYRLLVSREQRG
jgi:hypothetical protein